MKHLSVFAAGMAMVAASHATDVREIDTAILIERATKAASKTRPEISASDVLFNDVLCSDPDDPETCAAVIHFVVGSKDTTTIEGEMCKTVSHQRTLLVFIDYYDRVIVAPQEGTATSSSVKRCDKDEPDDT